MDSIIFDLDGTLWDSTHVIASAWDKIVKEKYNPAMDITPEVLKSHFGKTLPNIAKALFTKIPTEQQLELIDECCEAEHRALLATPPDVYDRVEHTLSYLSQKYKLFIVSNCQAGYIEVFLKATGLGAYFTDHLCPGDTGLEKAYNIQEIIRRNNLKHPVYVGDTAGDHAASKESGIPFVFASYGFGQTEDPDYTITCPKELMDLF